MYAHRNILYNFAQSTRLYTTHMYVCMYVASEWYAICGKLLLLNKIIERTSIIPFDDCSNCENLRMYTFWIYNIQNRLKFDTIASCRDSGVNINYGIERRSGSGARRFPSIRRPYFPVFRFATWPVGSIIHFDFQPLSLRPYCPY